ncbi:MAG: hypothetical protein EOO88_26220 [Pedobacter sp.]|nr:MAG: hypothetical protein EOO88_26220 [Pedobacter sp.]
MKKLFFVAAFAVVAVGGALTSNADTYWGPSGPNQQVYECEEFTNLCSQIEGDIYETPDNQTTPVNKAPLLTRHQ